ncbi:MAG: SIR2 family protein [Deltaproteobacteria bacterium]|nr:SIR2 family protein [Deltaproteobacteria bacterium]
MIAPTEPHVFVAHADLMRLACDAWLVPGGNGPGFTWRHALPPRPWRERPADWSQVGGARAHVLADVADDVPIPVLTDITGSNRMEPAWYVDGARDFLRVATAELRARRRAPLYGRPRYLLALPLLGTAGGGAAYWSGEITALLLPLLRDEAHKLATPGEYGVDVVLSLIEGPAWAAAQKARLDDATAFAGLPQALIEKADSLAERARSGGLTIFMGAGVSRPAGLPSWDELLHALAVDRLPADQLAAFDQLSVLDRAALLQRRLPPELALGTAVAALMRERSTRYALGQALLASLPVDEVVTTNYDALFEKASAVVGRPCARIPGQPVGRGERFILKMHGCVTRPSSIVLTREDYLRFQENRSALAGIVQALLLTRHMLFVGFGFTDDNFHRIAHAVRQALRGERGESVIKQQPFGTNLVVGGGGLLADLWSDDLDWVTMAEHAPSPAEQGRLVEIFLDRLSARAATVTTHLGDERYAGVLNEGEKMLRDRLLQLVADVTVAEQQTLAFDEVRALMRRLGLQAGSRHEREEDPWP